MHHLWYSQPVSEEHPITPNRPLRNGCIWRHYGARETHQTLKTVLGPRCVIFDHIIQSRCLSYRGGSQPASEEQRLYGAIGHIKHWKPCQGDPMCYFGTNNRLLIYPWCVILPTGQWGTPHYSQPATEERRLYGAIRHIENWRPCQDDPGLNNSKKSQVAHRETCWWKSGCPYQESGCPLLPSPIVNNKLYDGFMTHYKIKWNIHGIMGGLHHHPSQPWYQIDK